MNNQADSTESREDLMGRYASLFHTMTQGVVYQQADGVIIAANPAAELMLGLSTDDITGRVSHDPRWQAIRQDGSPFPGEEHPAMVALATGEVIRNIVMGVYNPSLNTHRWLLVDAIPLFRPGQDAPYQVYTLFSDISERLEQQQAIRNLNARLKRTMSETHHRIKNNLQVISAMVDLSVPPEVEQVPVSALRRIGQHARSLALIHDLLTQESRREDSAETISVKTTLTRLVHQLKFTIPPPRTIHLQTDECQLSVQAIGSLSLIVNELFANGVKHGKGDITIQFVVADQMAELTVMDQGDGYPEHFVPAQSSNMGLELIESAGTYDLKGSLSYENCPSGGACTRLRFPIRP